MKVKIKVLCEVEYDLKVGDKVRLKGMGTQLWTIKHLPSAEELAMKGADNWMVKLSDDRPGNPTEFLVNPDWFPKEIKEVVQ